MTQTRTFQPLSTRIASTLGAAFLLALPSYASGPAGMPTGAPADASTMTQSAAPLADERASYSFLRTLEGDATVAAAGKGIGEGLEMNQPLLTGDLVRVGSRSRLELALADRNRLHLDADTSIVLERLAFSGDREERITVLRLEVGEMLLEVADEALGDELPRVITRNATIYIQEPGQYRIETGVDGDGEGWTRVVTRRGFAEIVTDRGSSVVREDEAMIARGDRWARLELAAADGPDALERWSDVLADRAQRTSRSARYVEPHLAYDAAPLDEAGDWVEYESVRYWRPYVSAGWRPYWQGRWAWTPSGYTWVSYEPWGWVPYHYGRWCSLPGYGWAWRPGAIYSPAWVYWNWTSGWAGWVPMGYYTHFYNNWYGSGYRYGVYGWAGGGWGIYSDWNFAPVHCFRDRNFRGHLRTGRDRHRESGLAQPPRGLVTTDTRDFRPDRIDRTDRTEDLLHRIGERNRPDVGKDLPDMTDFVGRKGKLPTDVARVVVRDPRDDGKGLAVIRDIGRLPKVAEAPAWKQQEGKRSAEGDRSLSVKEPPIAAAGRVRKEESGPEAPATIGKPRTAAPRGAPAIDSRSSGGKNTDPNSGSRGVEARASGPKDTSSSGEDRQLWKDKGSGSAPVQRVVGSVRRPAPGGENKGSGSSTSGSGSARTPAPPAYGETKTTERAQPRQPYGQGTVGSGTSKPSGGNDRSSSGTQGSQSYGKGSSGSQGSGRASSGTKGSESSQSYGKGSSGSQGSQGSGRTSSGSQGSQSQAKGSSGSQGSQGSGRTSSGSQGSQGSQSYGKGSSGSQGSQGSGRASSGSQGAQSQAKGSSGSQGSKSQAKGSSGSQGSQGSGRTSSGSQGSQKSQPTAKSSSGSTGSKSSKSSQQSAPPPQKKDDDGNH